VIQGRAGEAVLLAVRFAILTEQRANPNRDRMDIRRVWYRPADYFIQTPVATKSMTSNKNIDTLAAQLHEGYRTGTKTSADDLKQLSIDEGYAVQRAFVSARNDEEGPVVGYKLGFTNEQIQRETGVSEPVYGHLLQDTVDVEAVRLADLINPRAEPEVMIRLGESLSATDSREEVADVVESVTPVIEVVDSRTGSWDLAPGTAVADNALAARLVTGPECQPSECPPLPDIEVTISSDDTKQTGRGEAVLGDPLEAVAWLSRTLDEPLPAGAAVSTGSLTNMVPLRSGTPVTASFPSLGEVTLHPE